LNTNTTYKKTLAWDVYLFIYLTNIIPLFEYAQNQEISNGSIILKPYIIIFYLFILFFIQILGSTNPIPLTEIKTLEICKKKDYTQIGL
jgi:hypothetical protein